MRCILDMTNATVVTAVAISIAMIANIRIPNNNAAMISNSICVYMTMTIL